MKKVFDVRDFSAPENPAHDGALPVLFCRSNKLYVANLQFPPGRVSFEWDKRTKVATMRVQLNEHEMLAVADSSGMAEKLIIEDRT